MQYIKWLAVFLLILPGVTAYVHYETLDNGQTGHVWNEKDDYYFNLTSGIQWTNHYNQYWSKNIFCGWYENPDRHEFCFEEVPYEWIIDTDNATYWNMYGWYDTRIGANQLGISFGYELNNDDHRLQIIPEVQNIGKKDITFDVGMKWKLTEIKADYTIENDTLFLSNNTAWDLDIPLNQTINLSFTNLNQTWFQINDEGFLELLWEDDTNYELSIISEAGQYNAPISLDINAGTLLAGENYSTIFEWYDPDYIMTGNSISASTTSPKQYLNISIEVDAGSKSGDWAVYVNGTNISGSGNTIIDGDCDDTGDAWKVIDLIEDGTICETDDAESSIANGYIWCDGAAGTGTQIFELETCAGGYAGNPFTFYSHCDGENANDICSGFGDSVGSINLNTPPTANLYTDNNTDFGTDQTPTLQFNGSDGNSDDLSYQIQIDNTSLFNSQDYLLDSYSELYADSGVNMYYGANIHSGQSFTGNGLNLTHVKFYLKKTGNPTGTITARLYTHTGTYGTNSQPLSQTPLATSDTITASTIDSTYTLIEFEFSSQYTLENGTYYSIGVRYDDAGSDSSNYISSYRDASSPTHEGNAYVGTATGFSAGSTADTSFYVYTGKVPLVDSSSSSDSGFSNNDTPADTNPFNSGELINYSTGLKIELLSSDEGDIAYILQNTIDDAAGQTFEAKGMELTEASFNLKRGINALSGTIVAKLYNHTGTFGTSGVPDGTALATSNTYDVSALTTNYQEINFTFPTPHLLKAGVYYVITVEHETGTLDPTHYINVYYDSTSPTANGNAVSKDWGTSTWDSNNNGDIVSSLKYQLDFGTYYWKVRAKDPLGSNTWGDWSETRTFNITEVINVAPTLTSVTAGSDPVASDATQTITAVGEADTESATLYFYCNYAGSPTAGNTICTGGTTSDSSPYDLTCEYTESGSGSATTYCRVYDGTSYSSPDRSVTYDITGGDTCTYGGSGNWEIDLEDNCIINTNYALENNNITFANTGACYFNSSINISSFETLTTDQSLYILENAVIRLFG